MRRPPRVGRRPGLALIAVLAQLTLIFMVWSLANRQCASTIAVEEALGRRSRRQSGSLAALSHGVGLLETGVPPESELGAEGTPGTYRCTVEVAQGGSTATYTLTYVLMDEATGRWSVSATPYAVGTDFGLSPPAPFE
ncbi:hypothetical protein [Tautonia plasticadhaerens]|uniref:Uncharacterized protein n=1 Tax=Tautonia plasticadhaerens TaxID=2527974 RepID=A0A518HFP8_9BACT|nr:hypothetical protein [Tautonia plasticadhaerens]QDV39670.1 hypothetical protein ElP_76420 [Tautonia plasticadhaerens]